MLDDDTEMTTQISSEINVTPMIDVLLSLLIIFMVASPPTPNHKQPINVPQDPVTESPDNPDATLLIEIDDAGKATLGKTPLSEDFEEMVSQLEKSEKAQQDDRIAIKASGKVAYGKVIRVMSAAREAGIGSVGLASDRI
jgi:biopolymer transport protein ExbD